MDPSNLDHFPWHVVHNNPEEFARILATDSQPSPNFVQVPDLAPDAFHPSGWQAPPDSFYPSFPAGRSGFSQTSGSEHDHQYNEIGAFAGPSSSTPYGHDEQTISFDDPYALPQKGPYHEVASYDQPFPPQPYNPYYQTSSFDEPSASQPCNPYYPTAAGEESSASHPFGTNYQAAAFDEPYSWQQFGQNAAPLYPPQNYSHPFDQHIFDKPSSSQQFGQNTASLYPTQDYSHPLHPHISETIPAPDLQPFDVEEAGNSPFSSQVDEPSAFAPSPHSPHPDYLRSQELQASLAVPFPRVWAREYDASILTRCLRAFSMSQKKSIAKFASLDKLGGTFAKSEMSKIFNVDESKSITSIIDHYNTMMARIDIGKIIKPKFDNFYRFEKGRNFHFVDIFREADSQISHDFGIPDIPLKYIQIIALLYGKITLSRKAIGKMLNMSPDTIRESIHNCNDFLTKHKSPVKIAFSQYGGECEYHLTQDYSEFIA